MFYSATTVTNYIARLGTQNWDSVKIGLNMNKEKDQNMPNSLANSRKMKLVASIEKVRTDTYI